MPNPVNSSENKKAFIRETVIPEQPRTPWWRKLLMTALLALVFGAVAGLSFFLTRGLLDSPTETAGSSYEEVTFGTDALPDVPSDLESDAAPSEADSRQATAGADASTDASGTVADSGEASEAEPDYQSIWESLMALEEFSLDNYQALYAAADGLAVSAGHSLVTVTATDYLDILDEDVAYDTDTFGVIIYISSQEVLILTPADQTALLSENSSLSVTFGNGVRAAAHIKNSDGISGLTVLAVTSSVLTTRTMNYITAIPLGNSYLCQTGQPVIALGAPNGHIGSRKQGIISFVDKSAQDADNSPWLLMTDMPGNADCRGFLINLKGELIGWIDPRRVEGGLLSAIGISDLKGYIEELSNGRSAAYLGILGHSLGSAVLPGQSSTVSGIRVTKCLDNSPAALAGLQEGDIIICLSDRTVNGLPALRTALLGINTGQMVQVTVLRLAEGSYLPLNINVRLELR